MARLVFLGTPDVAVPSLRELVAAGHDVALVVTRADKRRSRRGEPEPSPVKLAAEELGLPVTHSLDEVADVGAELGVVVAFGRIVPEAVLNRLPMVNVHFSMLPRWRGAAPVEWAILEGDAETGVCLMAVEAGLDTGPVYACEPVVIGEDESADHLRDRLVVIGSGLLRRYLAEGRAGLPRPRDQIGTPTYAEKIGPAQLELHWEESAVRLHRIVRLGRAWTTFRGHRLRVLEVQPALGEVAAISEPGTLDSDTATVRTGSEGRLRLVTVQPEGRRPMSATEWIRGARPTAGERLGA
jgi:methionyl-tRNA formyltransferase